MSISVSMVGRILKRLKKRSVLREPVPNYISVRKRRSLRPYAVRKPKEYRAAAPGDLVELDTLDVRPLPGVTLKHFSAYDVVSRWNVLGIFTRATATTARNVILSSLSYHPGRPNLMVAWNGLIVPTPKSFMR